MFGKFLLTVAVIAIIWFGYKYLGHLAELKRRDSSPRPSERPGREPRDAKVDAEAMVECRVCGTWQPSRTARSCGKADCPY
ncbi:hypothetical protein CU669_07060 [Paramagnetospirillum kuznetsovii]|uniref:Uncharacterized protein n=2 Tax=Paramagnetospirillum kuznetsovii TaxID=2053833 RepID=A0A364P073_9PROT|nr:hypothetical protein CU669_07060 [Paramagnetospirillum kuznetsovii]